MSVAESLSSGMGGGGGGWWGVAYLNMLKQGWRLAGVKGLKIVYCNNWASVRENLSSEVCEQQKRRPACASAQSDQRLCYSLNGMYNISTCYKRNFNFLASLCSWVGWFKSRYYDNPEDRFSRDEALIIMIVPRRCFWCCSAFSYKWLLGYILHFELLLGDKRTHLSVR